MNKELDLKTIENRIKKFRIAYIVLFSTLFLLVINIILLRSLVVTYMFAISGFFGRPATRNNQVVTSGDYTYVLHNKSYAEITGLSEELKESKIIIIPDSIDGYKVKCVNNHLFDDYEKSLNKVEYIIIGYEPDDWDSIIINCYSLKKIIFLNEAPRIKILPDGFYPDRIIYYSNDIVPYEMNYNDLKAANVVYYDANFNDEMIIYEKYFIDYYDNELISFKVDAPSHDGYTFVGWYKDKELTEKWDFDVDIVPTYYTDDNNKKYYNVTSLYAKFEKNE